MAEIGNVTVRVDAVITDEQYREAMGAVRAANERMDLLVAENAKLRHDLEEANNQAEEVCKENAKLRGLVKRAQTVIEDNCALCDYFTGCTILQDGRCAAQTLFRQELRELGVDDG